jgi:hypothetical protein
MSMAGRGGFAVRHNRETLLTAFHVFIFSQPAMIWRLKVLPAHRLHRRENSQHRRALVADWLGPVADLRER